MCEQPNVDAANLCTVVGYLHHLQATLYCFVDGEHSRQLWGHGFRWGVNALNALTTASRVFDVNLDADYYDSRPTRGC